MCHTFLVVTVKSDKNRCTFTEVIAKLKPGFRFMDHQGLCEIRTGFLGNRRQTTVELSTTAICSVFADYVFGNFRDKARDRQTYTKSLVSFSVIPKCMTVNDPEWLFRIKFCFRAGTPSVGACDFRKNGMKTNEDRPVLSPTKMFSKNCSFWPRFVHIRAVLENGRQMKIWYSKWAF